MKFSCVNSTYITAAPQSWQKDCILDCEKFNFISKERFSDKNTMLTNQFKQHEIWKQYEKLQEQKEPVRCSWECHKI